MPEGRRGYQDHQYAGIGTRGAGANRKYYTRCSCGAVFTSKLETHASELRDHHQEAANAAIYRRRDWIRSLLDPDDDDEVPAI
jgi:hypothetical protein